ncbi:hypothetical protein MMC07_003805 [Pseudocyphellaria aurata]|nr:hypothetical protein [Pseudocyphellaria aurata]
MSMIENVIDTKALIRSEEENGTAVISSWEKHLWRCNGDVMQGEIRFKGQQGATVQMVAAVRL